MAINSEDNIYPPLKINIVDSHCHLNCLDLKAFSSSFDYNKSVSNLDDVIKHAKANDVAHMLCVCIDLENFGEVLNIAQKYPFISASVGKHPLIKKGLSQAFMI